MIFTGRIALYPITACIVNAMSIMAALNATINTGILSRKVRTANTCGP